MHKVGVSQTSRRRSLCSIDLPPVSTSTPTPFELICICGSSSPVLQTKEKTLDPKRHYPRLPRGPQWPSPTRRLTYIVVMHSSVSCPGRPSNFPAGSLPRYQRLLHERCCRASWRSSGISCWARYRGTVSEIGERHGCDHAGIAWSVKTPGVFVRTKKKFHADLWVNSPCRSSIPVPASHSARQAGFRAPGGSTSRRPALHTTQSQRLGESVPTPLLRLAAVKLCWLVKQVAPRVLPVLRGENVVTATPPPARASVPALAMNRPRGQY